MTRRRALQLSGGVVGLSLAPSLAAQSPGEGGRFAKLGSLAPDLVNYSSEHFAALVAKLHKRTMQPEDLLNTASRANLLARHLELTGTDKAIRRCFSEIGRSGASLAVTSSATPTDDVASKNAVTRMRKYDASIDPGILSSLPKPNSLKEIEFLAKHGIAGAFRSSAVLLTHVAPVLAGQQRSAIASPVSLAMTPGYWAGSRDVLIQPAQYLADGVWRGPAHLERTCYAKPDGTIHVNLCNLAAGLTGFGVNELRSYLKDHPETLEELAVFMEVAPEAVLIMGVIAAASLVVIAATC